MVKSFLRSYRFSRSVGYPVRKSLPGGICPETSTKKKARLAELPAELLRLGRGVDRHELPGLQRQRNLGRRSGTAELDKTKINNVSRYLNDFRNIKIEFVEI